MFPSKFLACYEGIEARIGACSTQTAKYIAGEKPSKRQKHKVDEKGLKNLIIGYLHIQLNSYVAWRIELVRTRHRLLITRTTHRIHASLYLNLSTSS